MLNIILFIKLNVRSDKEIQKFYKHLRIFGLVNAILVIVSYFFPDLIEFFEAGSSRTGISRAFGLMGDEVSVFLSFFAYDALIFKRHLHFLLFLVAILFTGGIGASLTLLALIFYFLFFVQKVSLVKSSLFLVFGIAIISIFPTQINEVGVIKRVINNINSAEGESTNLRIISLSTAFNMIKEKPLLGYGYGNYSSVIYNKYKPLFIRAKKEKFFEGSAKVILSSSFNPYIQMLAEAGIIGLLFFIWFLKKMYAYTRISIPENETFLKRINLTSKGWLLVFFITTLTANWFLPSSFLMLLVVSLLGINLKLFEFYNAEYPQ